ncbi:MAG: alpha/beta hydrolase [Terriglobales bacterium]
MKFALEGELRSAFREVIFDAGGVNLNFAEGPDTGPPLLLLHGVGRNWQDFAPVIPGLGKKHHIFAVDFRGHGRSGHVASGYDVPQYSEDIVHFLRDRIKLPVAIFGHSLGGSVAIWIAAYHPSLVTAIIVGDSALSPERFESSIYPKLFAELHDIAVAGGPVTSIAEKLGGIELKIPGIHELIRIGDFPGNDSEYLQWWAQCLKQVDPEVFFAARNGSFLRASDQERVLRMIQCPVMLLQANPDLDGLMSDDDVKRAMSWLANPSHVYCPTLGHALHQQQAEPVLRAVRKFLESVKT